MESKIFDKDTLLDLMVNFIPLGIILFFIAAFTLYAPWGFDVRGFAPMMVIMVTMFIALAVLTYVSGKAIAGDEKRKPVYAQGQAGLKGAKTRHELEEEADNYGTDAAVEESTANESTEEPAGDVSAESSEEPTPEVDAESVETETDDNIETDGEDATVGAESDDTEAAAEATDTDDEDSTTPK